MYEIEMHEAEEEFARCWQAAGLHLQSSAQGRIDSWLRAELSPPFLEHLSFRLGNQLFFVRLEDVERRLETPGNPGGLFQIAEGCNGRACVMPMRKVGAEWQPMAPGWGLIDAHSGDPIDPAALITDELIPMTDWEVQDFAVQIVRNQLIREKREIMSWHGSPHVDPSIWFVGDKGPEWVVVRAIRYPATRAARPANLADIAESAAKLSRLGNLAWVKVANADDPFDPMAADNGNYLPLYRGHGMVVSYEGLQPVGQAEQ